MSKSRDLRSRSIDARSDAPGSLRSRVLVSVLGATFALSIASSVFQSRSVDFAYDLASFRQYAYIALFGAAVIALDPRKPQNFFSMPISILAVFAWSWSSLLWSADPGVALPRLVLTTIVTWLVFASVSRVGAQQSLGVVRVIVSLALLACFVAVVISPKTAIHAGDLRQWRGLMGEKNEAGALAAVVALLWLFVEDPRRRLHGLLVASLAVVFLWNTNSRTAIIMFGVSGAVGAGVLFYGPKIASISLPTKRAWWYVWLSVWGSFIVVLAFFTFSGDAIKNLVSDPGLLSRRGEIWRVMLSSYQQSPWGGTGFGSYWGREEIADFGGSWLRGVNHGHSGFLDMAVQIGLLGFLLVLVAIVILPSRDFMRLVERVPARAAAPVALFTFAVGSNLTESGLFERDRFWWIVLTLALATMRIALQQRGAPMTNVSRRSNAHRSSGPKPPGSSAQQA